jgi:hypothetical protein
LKRKAAAPQHATRNTHRASVIVHRNEHLETCNAHRLTRTPQHKTGACARAAERAGGAASSEGAAADNGRWGRRQQRATCADAPAKTVACARAAERAGGATCGDGAARTTSDGGGDGQRELARAQPRGREEQQAATGRRQTTGDGERRTTRACALCGLWGWGCVSSVARHTSHVTRHTSPAA